MNFLMNLFLTIFEISFNTSLIIITVLIFRKLTGKRFSAAARYIIWIFIIIRLALPIEFDLGTAVFEFDTDEIVSENSQFNFESPEITEQLFSIPTPVTSPAVIRSDVKPADVSHKSGVSVDASAADDFSEPDFKAVMAILLYIGTLIWAVGAVVYILWSIIGYRIFTKNIEREQSRVYDKRVLLILDQMCGKLEIGYLPELYLCGCISSPLIYGISLRRKRIVIPSDIGNSAAITSILRHELVHLKRGDLWVKLILLVAESLHWFNPMVKICSKYLELDMELACDEKVLDGCNKSVRQTYGRILIDIAQRCAYRPTALTTHFNPEFNDLKTRCINILDTKAKYRGTFVAVLFAVLCVLSGTVLNCTQIQYYASNDTAYEEYADVSKPEKLDLQDTNIILSNKINSVIDTSNNFELNNFLKFIERFSKVVYGDINDNSGINLSDTNVLSYILDETYLREGGTDESVSLYSSDIKQTVRDIFGIEAEMDIPEDGILCTGNMTDVPELLINIINVNANEYGEVVTRMMLYDISAADSGMSSDTYIGEGTYYFSFRNDDKYGQIYTLRFCFGEREYINYKNPSSPILTQSRDENLQIIYPDMPLIMTPAYFKGDSSSLGTFNKLSCVGGTIAIAGKSSKEYAEPFYTYVTHDYGVSWTVTEIDYTKFMTDTGMRYPVINFIFNFTDENNGILILCTKRPELFVYTTTDGGLTWNKRSNTIPSDNSETLYSHGFVTNQIGFASMIPVYNSESNPKLYMTRDGGFSWQLVSVNMPENYGDIWRMLPETPELVGGQIRIPIIINMRDILYYVSDDMGETWYWN